MNERAIAPDVGLAQRADSYLRRLCVDIPGRVVGSRGNRLATDFFAETAAAFSFAAERATFGCINWTGGGADLSVGGAPVAAQVSPYSLGCRVRAPLVAASSFDALVAAPIAGAVVLLRGELASEPLMPKRFPFYNPERHRQIIAALEAGRPRAIIAATGRSPAMAGGLDPFPLFEDGDFDIPSVYVREEDGERLAAQAGAEVTLAIEARRAPASGCNVIARRGDAARRLVVCAHIDAKGGTPGALDNAAGVAVLLLLAELFAGYEGRLGLELVAMNGEDHYAAAGELLYLKENAGRFDSIVLGVNIDGVGYRGGRTAYSLYGCPDGVSRAVERALGGRPDMVPGEPWYQGDHSLFLMERRPALALTSEDLAAVTAITHTARDTPDRVDGALLAGAALALRDLVAALGAPV